MDALLCSMQLDTMRVSAWKFSFSSIATFSTLCMSAHIKILFRRNGDTCMHYAAAYNSLASMVIVSNFGGFELLLRKNKQGKRPIDIAEGLKNYECY